MEKRKTFTFTLDGINKWKNCYFVPARYVDPPNLALQIMNDEQGEIAICTVNPSRYKGDDVLCVKDYSENCGMTQFLVKMGIIKDEFNWADTEESGYIFINAYTLTKKGKALFANVPETEPTI